MFGELQKAAVAAAAVGVAASLGAAVKFVGYGWDTAQYAPKDFVMMADEFGRTGLDGVIVGVPEMSNASAMSPMTLTHELVEKYVDDLRQFRERPGLSESFVLAAWSPIPKTAPRLDWRDDAAWEHFAANMRTYAWLAKAAGMKGLFIDNEDYLQKRQFWRAEGEPPYAQLRLLARQRGAQVGRAMFGEYPEIVCIVYWLLTIDPGYMTALDPVAYRDTKEDLWPSFIDGLLDVLPKTATLIDGDEHGYVYVAEKRDFAEAIVARTRRLVRLLAPENQAKYRGRVKMSFGQYMDMYTNPPDALYYQLPKDGSRLARFRDNLSGAVAAADDYVWFYGEKQKWVHWPNFKPRAAWMKIGQETWEEKLPGFARMLQEAKEPLAALRNELDEQRAHGATNLLACALANPKSYWKGDDSKIGFDFQTGGSRRGGVRISTTGHGNGCVLLSAGRVVRGEEYVGEIHVHGRCSRICLCWQKDGAWRWSVPAAEAVVGEPDADGWRRAIMRTVVPDGVDGMVLKTDVGPKDGEKVEFDDAFVCRALSVDR